MKRLVGTALALMAFVVSACGDGEDAGPTADMSGASEDVVGMLITADDLDEILPARLHGVAGTQWRVAPGVADVDGVLTDEDRELLLRRVALCSRVEDIGPAVRWDAYRVMELRAASDGSGPGTWRVEEYVWTAPGAQARTVFERFASAVRRCWSQPPQGVPYASIGSLDVPAVGDDRVATVVAYRSSRRDAVFRGTGYEVVVLDGSVLLRVVAFDLGLNDGSKGYHPTLDRSELGEAVAAMVERLP